MGAPHGHKLHFHGHSWLHRLPAHVKLVALVAFMLMVVATPREWYPVFAGYFLLLFVLVAISHVPPTYLAKRMVVEVPFVVFAAAAAVRGDRPAGRGARAVAERAGLLGAWGLLVKGTLGVLASLLLAATTEPRALLAGLERLRMPPLLVQIMGFMIRYLDVVTDELRRMHVARESRGFSARDPRQWPVIAKSAGVLFIRSYERGERVHLAMLSRGYDGRMPRVSVPVLDLQGVAFAYPDGHQALHGVDLHVHQGERVALLGPNGAGKTTLVLHLNGILMPGLGSVTVSGLPVDQGEPPRDPPPGRHRLPGPRRPAVHGHGPRGRRLRAQEPRPARRRARAPGARRRSRRSGWRSTPTARRTTSPSASAAGSRSPRCWRCSRRSWCSTSRRPTSTRPRAASSPTSCGRWTSPCSWSPTTCRTPSSCARGR